MATKKTPSARPASNLDAEPSAIVFVSELSRVPDTWSSIAMPCSNARLLANRCDAQKSKGRKTEAGKLASRMNSLTRGMRSEHGLVPPHLTEAVAKHNEMLIDAYHPENDRQAWLLEQVADAAARLDYCQFMLRAELNDMADRADLCWDEDRCRAVEEIAVRLQKDPARTASRLRETAQGCRWILARWDALSVPLADNAPWDEAQCNLAASLIGVGPDLRASYPALNPSACPSDQIEIMCDHVDTIHTLMVDALEPLDAKQRELTRMGYPLRPSKEYLRFERHETRLRKVYDQAMQAFRQCRAESVAASEPITFLPTDPEPSPLPSARANCPTPEPEPEPEPIPPATPLFKDKPIMSLPAAPSDSVGNGSTPSGLSPVPLTSAMPKPDAAPLNRKARRAREKAARKLRAIAG